MESVLWKEDGSVALVEKAYFSLKRVTPFNLKLGVWWYYSSNQSLIREAGWQSPFLHNELVLYLEYIIAFTLLIGLYLNYNLKLKHQLILRQDFVCSCLKFIYI